MLNMTSWSIDRNRQFVFKHWPDASVAYDIITGDTHLLEPLAMELLEIMNVAAAADTQSLVDEICLVLEDEPRGGVGESVSVTLQRLKRDGFIVGHER